MNKIIVALVVFALSSFALEIKAHDQKTDIATLTQRVDSLEREVEFLKLNSELRSLYSDIKMLDLDVYTLSVDIRLEMSNHFDPKLCESYKSLYKTFILRNDAISKNIRINQLYFELMLATTEFNDIELAKLNVNMDLINNANEMLNNSLEMLRLVINAYESRCVIQS